MNKEAMKRYYLDHNATTPVRPEVREAMMPFLVDYYGNPSSVHAFGREARHAMEVARGQVAELISAEPEEIYFTGCGTESDNIAIQGVIRSLKSNRKELVTSKVEHSAIMKTARYLDKHHGYHVKYLDVDENCEVRKDQLRDTVSVKTGLLSIMHGNNETGVIQDIGFASAAAKEHGALFHTDAIQSVGKIPIDVRQMDIDLLSLSGHKINAPKGIGALYIKKGLKVEPITYGGGHESGLRPGTENVAGIVALGKACELAGAEMEQEAKHLSTLRDKLEKGISISIDNIFINGQKRERLPGTSNISFPGVDGEALLISLDLAGIAVSTGSACTTGDVEPSHVLVAMGIDPRTAQSSIRFSLGYGVDEEAINHVLEILPPTVERLRQVAGGV